MASSIVLSGDNARAKRFLCCVSTDVSLEWEWEEECFDSTKLYSVTLANCNLISSDLASFPMQYLLRINVSFNKLEDLKFISAAVKLQRLDASHNKISSLDDIRGLRNLRMLRVNNNNIEKLGCLSVLSSLSEFWISDNKIPWKELMNLSPLGSCLTAIMAYNNPLEKSKDKIMEFVCALCPSIQMMDGESVTKGGSFLQTADGRVMLTQARANVPVTERVNLIQANKTLRVMEGGETCELQSAPSGMVSSPRQSYVISNDELASVGANGATLGRRQRQRALEVPTFRATLKGTGRRSSLKKNSYSDTNDGENTATFTDTVEGSVVNRGSDRDLECPSPHRNRTVIHDFMEEKSLGKGTVLHFGMIANDYDENGMIANGATNAPIAVSIDRGGKEGFIRWSSGSTVACSIDNGKLFASYRTGSIAVVLDRQGNGSVMDNRGKCVLLLTSKPPISSTATKGLERVLVMDPKSGEVLQTFVRGDECNGSATVYTKNIEGILIEFLPATWDLKVTISNERATCQLSLTSGIHIIKEEDVVDPKELAKRERTAKEKARKQRTARENLNHGDHSSMRQGIGSVVNQLDDMLAAMNTKR